MDRDPVPFADIKMHHATRAKALRLSAQLIEWPMLTLEAETEEDEEGTPVLTNWVVSHDEGDDPIYDGDKVPELTAEFPEAQYHPDSQVLTLSRGEVPDRGRGVIVVISAGTSVRESEALIRAAGATPAGVLIALDRQERGQGAMSATQEVSRNYGIPVAAIATLDDVLATLRARADFRDRIPAIEDYRRQYGV